LVQSGSSCSKNPKREVKYFKNSEYQKNISALQHDSIHFCQGRRNRGLLPSEIIQGRNITTLPPFPISFIEEKFCYGVPEYTPIDFQYSKIVIYNSAVYNGSNTEKYFTKTPKKKHD